MTEPSDLVLLDLWRGGDAAAGEALFLRHFDSIYRFFETKYDAHVDDLVQSTFLNCLRARDQFRKESSFRTYLFTIARHELYGALRGRQRDGARLDFQLSSIAELVSTPGTRIARNQEHRQLVDALRQLPIEQQTLLELHYWDDLDIAALAEVFEAPQPTIRTRLHRARKALREKMASVAPQQAFDTLESMDTWARGLSQRAAR